MTNKFSTIVREHKFPLMVEILDLLLQGLAPKQVAAKLGISISVVSDAKNFFPLFLGLKNKYTKR